MRFNLFTTYYHDSRVERRDELLQCLLCNAASFDSVNVMVQGEAPLAWNLSGLNLRLSPHRQRYCDLLAWMSGLVEHDDVSIIANCDLIIPPISLDQIAKNLDGQGCYCLGRYDLQEQASPRLWEVDYSQDVWAFAGKLMRGIGGDYFFGVPGCDNRFAHELHKAGYRVENPSRSIRTYHFHQSKQRTLTNTQKHRVPPPYLFVAPHALGETARLSERLQPR
jgi:hypothetical protein